MVFKERIIAAVAGLVFAFVSVILVLDCYNREHIVCRIIGNDLNTPPCGASSVGCKNVFIREITSHKNKAFVFNGIFYVLREQGFCEQTNAVRRADAGVNGKVWRPFCHAWTIGFGRNVCAGVGYGPLRIDMFSIGASRVFENGVYEPTPLICSDYQLFETKVSPNLGFCNGGLIVHCVQLSTHFTALNAEDDSAHNGTSSDYIGEYADVPRPAGRNPFVTFMRSFFLFILGSAAIPAAFKGVEYADDRRLAWWPWLVGFVASSALLFYFSLAPWI